MNQLSVTSFSPKTVFPSLCASVPSLSSPLHPVLHRTLSPIGKELSPVAERTPTFLPHPLTRSKPSFAALLKRTCWFLTNIKNLIRIVTRIRMCRGRKKLGHAQAFYTLFQTFPPVGSWNWRIYFHRSLFFFFLCPACCSLYDYISLLHVNPVWRQSGFKCIISNGKNDVPDTGEGEAAGNKTAQPWRERAHILSNVAQK